MPGNSCFPAGVILKVQKTQRNDRLGAREAAEGPAVSVDEASRLPELQQAVLAVRADQVLVGVVGDADHILFVDLEDNREQLSLQPEGEDEACSVCGNALQKSGFEP